MYWATGALTFGDYLLPKDQVAAEAENLPGNLKGRAHPMSPLSESAHRIERAQPWEASLSHLQPGLVLDVHQDLVRLKITRLGACRPVATP